jgi:hypothetical protein
MKLTLGKLNIEITINLSWEKPYLKQVKQALREGRRLQAVKIYKDATGLGLKDSKDAVDLLLPKYYNKDYNLNPNAVSTVQHQGSIPTDVKTFYFDSHPAPAVKDATLKQFTLVPIPNPGVGSETEKVYGVMRYNDDPDKPNILYAGTYEQCLLWKQMRGGIGYSMGTLTEAEIKEYNSRPNPNAGE